MSAFIVTEETINCCCRGWYDEHSNRPPDCAELDSIGRELWAMNAAAVAVRYNEAPEKLPRFKYRPAIYSLAQQFKALQCLKYQCTEGRIDETELYKKLAERCAAVAAAIVMESAEYKAAAWNLQDKPRPSSPRLPAAKPAAKPAPILAAVVAAATCDEF